MLSFAQNFAFSQCLKHRELPPDDSAPSQSPASSSTTAIPLFPTITFSDSHGFMQTPSQGSSRRAFNPFTKFQGTIHSLNDSWQTYDIIFHGPRFDASGKLTRPARETIFHNGVLVQDNVELTGPRAITSVRRTRPVPTSCRWRFRTTTTRSATATSGFEN